MANATHANETVIYYSKSTALLWLVFYLFLEGIVGTVLFQERLPYKEAFWWVAGLMLLLASGRQLWLLCTSKVLLTLSSRGIQLATAPLDSWKIIRGEEVKRVTRLRSTETFLSYTAGTQVRRVDIRELNIDAEKLTLLLRLYRTQFQQPRSR